MFCPEASNVIEQVLIRLLGLVFIFVYFSIWFWCVCPVSRVGLTHTQGQQLYHTNWVTGQTNANGSRP